MNAVEAAKATGLRHVVKLSALNTEDDSYALGRVHRVAEKVLEKSDLNWTFLRASQFMQNLSTYMAPQIKEEDAIYTACGEGKISHVDVRDIGRMAFWALTDDKHLNKVYEVTGPETMSYDEVASLLSESLGRTIKHVHINDKEYREILVSIGTPEVFAERLVGLDQYFRSGAAEKISHDIEFVTGQKANSVKDFVREFSEGDLWKA